MTVLHRSAPVNKPEEVGKLSQACVAEVDPERWHSPITMLVREHINKKSFISPRRASRVWMMGNALGLLIVGTMTAEIKKIQNRVALHKWVKLRQRYILNKHNKLRLRYVALNVVMLGLASSFVFQGVSAAFFVEGETVSGSSVSVTQQMAAAEDGQGDVKRASDAVRAQISDGMRRAAVALRKAEKPRYQEIKIGSGDTVGGALQDAGMSGRASYLVTQAMGKHFDVRKVKPGQRLGVYFSPRDEAGVSEVIKIVLKIDTVREVVVEKDHDLFVADLIEKELKTRSHAKFAEIETSLYGSAARAGIPAQVIANLIRTYSWNVDFQRDIRRGDKIEVLYDTYETKDGEFARYGNILYASLSVGGKKIPIYRYEMEDGTYDYFEPDGHSIRKTLMKTPIDGARLSSGFGMRKHPILGYDKMHKGTDFAAPTGTPIYASGDGTIDYAGRKGAYGNYIRIRHNSTLKTAYAHMHRLAKGMVRGKRVEQGDVIGYVGTTGRSTGPHLHYEVLVREKQTNPRSVNLPVGEMLAGSELKSFKALKGALYQQYTSLVDGVKFAQIDSTELR